VYTQIFFQINTNLHQSNFLRDYYRELFNTQFLSIEKSNVLLKCQFWKYWHQKNGQRWPQLQMTLQKHFTNGLGDLQCDTVAF